MDGMLGAIQKRRGGGMLNDDEENAHQAPLQEEKQAGGLEDLVATLDPAQKQQLLKILVADQNENSNAPEIEKGAMGPGEEEELADAAEEGLEGDEHESEEQIAQSMVGSSDMTRSARGDVPRNLGERVKFDLAKKLKGKGSY